MGIITLKRILTDTKKTPPHEAQPLEEEVEALYDRL